MERLKAWYISVYLLVASLASLHILLLLSRTWRVEWVGALMACSAFPGFLIWLSLRRPARTTAHLFGVTCFAWLGTCLAVFGTLTASDPDGWPVLFALPLGLGGFLLYLLWYSRLSQRGRQLQLLSTLPDVTLYGLDGAPVTNRDLLGKPVVWLFFRGNWCPLCVAQVHEIAAHYRQLSEQGVTVALVSPQPLEKTRALARRFDVPLLFLQDRENTAAETLGIAHHGGVPVGLGLFGYGRDSVLPTVLVTNGEGEIIFLDQSDNYRVRPEPQTFMKVIERERARRAGL
ncbi:peroxiredoxin family protein [Alcanivorax sp. JB21]|uniref:peroxiredoxin family protein n=1 Tax=Alcanivorax limicola TaxID=2874102 RepID=UPI001CC0123B|nr:redoxin domain-containing protein [Alcanivorax limicola]MBZ2187735.1 peroxiredoxin family protein [Alcanivorax limicola]